MITEGVVLIGKNGRIAFANNSFAELSGVDNHALTGMLFTQFVVRQDKQRVERFFLHLIQSLGTVKDTTEFSFKNRSGNEYMVEMNARTLTHEKKINILASVSDITERRKKRNKLKKLLDLIPEVVLTTAPEDCTRIVNISNATEKLCAIPSEAFTSGSFHIFDIVHPDDFDGVMRFYNDIIVKEFDSLEYRIISFTISLSPSIKKRSKPIAGP